MRDDHAKPAYALKLTFWVQTVAHADRIENCNILFYTFLKLSFHWELNKLS